MASSVIDTHVDSMIDGMDFWNDLTTSFTWEEDLGPYEFMGMRSDRRIRYQPYGVVGAITPWNAPFMTAIWKVHPLDGHREHGGAQERPGHPVDRREDGAGDRRINRHPAGRGEHDQLGGQGASPVTR